MFSSILASPAEKALALPGDQLLDPVAVVMDRAFSVPGRPEVAWPWLQQLGKQRAGWYFPRWVEHVIPRRRRGLWHIDPQWQLHAGLVVPDWGGKHATFTVADIVLGHYIVYRSQRGATNLTWAIVLSAEGPESCRVQLRLRLAPVKHRWLALSIGELMDKLTVAGLAAGLRERLTQPADER